MSACGVDKWGDTTVVCEREVGHTSAHAKWRTDHPEVIEVAWSGRKRGPRKEAKDQEVAEVFPDLFLMNSDGFVWHQGT